MARPISVGVKVGATTFTRTLGARSAAKAMEKPSSADLAAEIAQWLGRPELAATEDRNTMDPLSVRVSFGSSAFVNRNASNTLVR